jgi:hypothetical protein
MKKKTARNREIFRFTAHKLETLGLAEADLICPHPDCSLVLHEDGTYKMEMSGKMPRRQVEKVRRILCQGTKKNKQGSYVALIKLLNGAYCREIYPTKNERLPN